MLQETLGSSQMICKLHCPNQTLKLSDS